MPAIKLPQQGQWRGIFPGKYKGELWQTYNIDLEKSEGRISLSDKARIVADSDTDLASLGVPLQFLLTNADATLRWWALTSGGMFKSSDSAATGWSSDSATAGSPLVPLDMTIHEGAAGEQRLIVSCSDTTGLRALNDSTANAWTTNWWITALGQSALNTSVGHPLHTFNRLLAVADQDSATLIPMIHTIDRNKVVAASRLTFQQGEEIRSIISTESHFWFGAQNNFEGNGRFYLWDGSSENYNREFPIAGQYPLVTLVVNGIPYVVTERGYIQRFSSSGFETVQQFPIVEEKLLFSVGVGVDATIQIHGAVVEGHLIKMLVGSPLTSRRMRDGIWIFNTITKDLYQTVGVGHHRTAGTDLGYGGHLNRVGGLAKLVPSGAQYIIGANVLKNASTGKNAIMRMIDNSTTGSNTGRNRGYFITNYIKGANINEFWNGLWVRYRRFISNGNLIRVFFRTRDPKRDADDADDSVLQVTGTWVSTTTFTAPVPTGVVVGESIEVLSGDNSGSVYPISVMTDTNIAAVTPNGSTSVIVTINDTAITSSTATFHARFDNFRLAGTISDTASDGEFAAIPGGDSDENNLNLSDEVQFLVELRGFSQEIKNLLPVYTPGRRIEP